MFTTVIQRFARRLLSLALIVTVVGGMSGMALVAYFARDLVEYFISGSNRTVAAVAVIEQPAGEVGLR
jgi:hypothetical protein